MTHVLYFAHAVNCYGTPYEKAALELIAKTFPDAIVENPNQLKHQDGYTAYQERTAKSRDDHKGMSYFYDEVLPNCTGCVAMPFLDGRFGLGVAGEAQQCLETGKPVWLMTPVPSPAKQYVHDWMRNSDNGLFIISLVTNEERAELLATNKEGSTLVVGHQETRLRTWLVYGVKQRAES